MRSKKYNKIVICEDPLALRASPLIGGTVLSCPEISLQKKGQGVKDERGYVGTVYGGNEAARGGRG